MSPEMEKLNQAERLIGEVQATLKTELATCPACGNTGPANRDDLTKHINHEMLGAATSRIRKVWEWFDRQPE